MKTDAEIRRDVESELQWDPSIDDKRIGVTVQSGVVTLTGGRRECAAMEWVTEQYADHADRERRLGHTEGPGQLGIPENGGGKRRTKPAGRQGDIERHQRDIEHQGHGCEAENRRCIQASCRARREEHRGRCGEFDRHVERACALMAGAGRRRARRVGGPWGHRRRQSPVNSMTF